MTTHRTAVEFVCREFVEARTGRGPLDAVELRS
jgi:hypothetical protein